MGGWKLEVFKMACYMTFPVGAFYCFNRPEIFFEQDVIEIRQKLYPPEDPEKTAAFKKMIKDIQLRQQDRELELLQKNYEQKKAQTQAQVQVQMQD